MQDTEFEQHVDTFIKLLDQETQLVSAIKQRNPMNDFVGDGAKFLDLDWSQPSLYAGMKYDIPAIDIPENNLKKIICATVVMLRRIYNNNSALNLDRHLQHFQDAVDNATALVESPVLKFIAAPYLASPCSFTLYRTCAGIYQFIYRHGLYSNYCANARTASAEYERNCMLCAVSMLSIYRQFSILRDQALLPTVLLADYVESRLPPSLGSDKSALVAYVRYTAGSTKPAHDIAQILQMLQSAALC